MIMRAAIVSGVFALSACQADVTHMAGDGGLCGASGYQSLIGQNIAAVTMPQNAGVRVIGPDTAVTMDYVPERLNIQFNDDGIIERVSCG